MAQPEAISIAGIAPGDLIFVEPSNDPVSSLVTQLDIPGRFSHVGVCTAPDTMLNARTQRSYDPERDMGGLRRDSLKYLLVDEGRGIYTGRPRERADVELALKEIDGHYLALEREDGDTDFSIVKLFLVATALHAFSPVPVPGADPAPLQNAVLRAAQAWDVSRASSPKHVAFYCAEFVALAFGHTFTLGEFKPDAPIAPPVVGDVDPTVLVGPKSATGQALMDSPFDERGRALLGVVIELYRYDPAFIVARARDVWHLFYETIKGGFGPLAAAIAQCMHGDAQAVGGLLPDAAPPPLEDTAVIPFALATPRLLETAPWMGEIHPVRP